MPCPDVSWPKLINTVTGVNLQQTIQVDDELEVTAYYAGHVRVTCPHPQQPPDPRLTPTRAAATPQVLGAAMFHIRVGHASVVYTGDYNMTPDRHLGAAWIDKVRPDVLITESTYATTIRDSKRARERDFLKKVHECVAQNGKVGLPPARFRRCEPERALMGLPCVQRQSGAHPRLCPRPRPGAVHPAGHVLGAHEPQSPHLL